MKVRGREIPWIENGFMRVKDMNFQSIQSEFQSSIVPNYGRYEVAFVRGSGNRLFDSTGKQYLDLAAGIAVCSLGHAHPELVETLHHQAKELWHVSNLFYQEPQGHLGSRIRSLLGGGKVFFCNSGGEANEALFKMARKYGNADGKFEILTALNSFHGRTLAGITATGQDKVKTGFEPLVPGFRHIPFNDLTAAENALSDKTIAILIEGIQGEGGIVPATPEYLLGLRKLCDERGVLLLLDSIQCGMFRSGRFQSYQRVLEKYPDGKNFSPDAITMAKGLGGGFPIGALWARDGLAEVLGPGSHGTTFGGNLLATAVANKVLEIVERDGLDKKVREVGNYFSSRLQHLRECFPTTISEVRGMGLMLGLEFFEGSIRFPSTDKPVSAQVVSELLQRGIVCVPAGPRVVRFVPSLTLSRAEVDEAVDTFKTTLQGK